jgi:hypothetical protein
MQEHIHRFCPTLQRILNPIVGAFHLRDHIAAKKIIAPALNAMAGGPSRMFQQTTQVMEEAAHALASHAIASGDLRPDVDPIDLMRAIYGLSTAGSADDWPAKRGDSSIFSYSGSRP